MSRVLYIMRHAKSAAGEYGQRDRDRPLSKRGKLDAQRVGAELAQRGWLPALIVRSPAARARATAKRLLDGTAHDIPCTEDDRLYHESHRGPLSVVRSLPNETRSAMIIGHNPSLEQLLQVLLAEIVPLATANVVRVLIAADRWRDVGGLVSAHRDQAIIRPRKLQAP